MLRGIILQNIDLLIFRLSFDMQVISIDQQNTWLIFRISVEERFIPLSQFNWSWWFKIARAKPYTVFIASEKAIEIQYVSMPVQNLSI